MVHLCGLICLLSITLLIINDASCASGNTTSVVVPLAVLIPLPSTSCQMPPSSCRLGCWLTMKPPYDHVGGMVASYEPPTIGVSTGASWLIVVCVVCGLCFVFGSRNYLETAQ